MIRGLFPHNHWLSRWDVVEKLAANSSNYLISDRHPIATGAQQYVSCLESQLNASHKVCYPALLIKGLNKFNLLNSVDERENLPFVLSLASQKNASFCYVINELGSDHNADDLIKQLRAAALSEHTPLLYWPEFFHAADTKPLYWGVLHNWIALSGGLFVAHQPEALSRLKQAQLQDGVGAQKSLIYQQNIPSDSR